MVNLFAGDITIQLHKHNRTAKTFSQTSFSVQFPEYHEIKCRFVDK